MNGDSTTPDPIRLPVPRKGLSPARRESAIVRRGYLEVRVGFVAQGTLDRLLASIQWSWSCDWGPPTIDVDEIVKAAKRISWTGYGFDIRNETVQRIVISLCDTSRVFFETDLWRGYFPAPIGDRLCSVEGQPYATPKVEAHGVVSKALSTIIGQAGKTSSALIWILRSGVGQARLEAAASLQWYPLEEVGQALREVQNGTDDRILAARCRTTLTHLTSANDAEVIRHLVDWYASETEHAVRTWVGNNIILTYFFCYENALQVVSQLLTYETEHCNRFAAHVAKWFLPGPQWFHELATQQVEPFYAVVEALHDRGQEGLEYLIDSLPTELERRRLSSEGPETAGEGPPSRP